MKQGIGSRIQRKEDVRHLYGRGNFVTDMMLPGQSDVAFVRSPVAHARILKITKPPDFEASVYVRDDLTDVGAMVTPNTVPGYKLSAWHPLAHKKVRYVGEAVAMCVAPSRAAAEDICELVDIEFEDLPVLMDAPAARKDTSVRVHEEWADN
ncbi:MAG: aerobic carbon-monoxide dehydrogenase large subunit, partial [Betaproteobacteria bacterium]|nr:aerobic carbon-monoxide dehydrogenase large subunit [Betaproteobacteria bacterium]